MRCLEVADLVTVLQYILFKEGSASVYQNLTVELVGKLEGRGELLSGFLFVF